MASVPVIPDSAPFTAEQRAWLNGFIAGLLSRGEVDPAATAGQARAGATSTPAALVPLTILFGSQTGTAEALAKRAAKEAGRRGFAATVMDMGTYPVAQLAQEKNVLVITSTYGEGDPPDNAQALHAALKGNCALQLHGVRFSVCGLGDTNYVQFCQCGRDFDAYLEKLGAQRVAPRADCDVDYEATFAAWLNTSLGALSVPGAEATAQAPDPPVSGAIPAAMQAAPVQRSEHSRRNPFPAPVLAVRRLSGRGSTKEVNHIELALAGSGLAYEAGDALGVFPQNDPELVNAVLSALGCDGEEAVCSPRDAGEIPLRRALTECYDLGRPTGELLALMGDALPEAVRASSQDTGAPAAAVPAFDVLDALRTGSIPPAPQEFVACLRKLPPRLYSIASSPKAHPGEVHLTVGAVRYEANGRARRGVCSTFLADYAHALGRVGAFVHANPAFRLPASDDVPVIMIGPGTGIAPFRAFLEERRARGARGDNWLFFGDRHEATDFLYRDELLAFHRDGLLTRLDLAWSRDQPDRVYVQQRMREHAKTFFAWLEAGAHVYVCGDAARMAKDVDAALHDIVASAGGKTREGAVEYMQALKAGKRYRRDVY